MKPGPGSAAEPPVATRRRPSGFGRGTTADAEVGRFTLPSPPNP